MASESTYTPSDLSSLAASNNATLNPATGHSLPVVTLNDGSKVPTGTVGALMVNMRAYDEAYNKNDEAAMADLEPKIRMAIPLLKKIGFFDLFSVDEWMAGEGKGLMGRALVGQAAKEAGA